MKNKLKISMTARNALLISIYLLARSFEKKLYTEQQKKNRSANYLYLYFNYFYPNCKII